MNTLSSAEPSSAELYLPPRDGSPVPARTDAGILRYALASCESIDPASSYGKFMRRQVERQSDGIREELLTLLTQLENARRG